MSLRKTLLSSQIAGQIQGVMSVRAFLRWSNICRSKFYDEVREGRLFPKKIGSRTVIPEEEAERWLRALPDADFGSSRRDQGRE